MDIRSKILVIYTGGTIGSIATANGLDPLTGEAFENHMRKTLNDKGLDVDFDFMQSKRSINSSQALIEDWSMVGQMIHDAYSVYDGFVVLHGTDSMDYLGAALHVMFKGLDKPVVISGAMKPLAFDQSDAESNLYWSFRVAQEGKVKGVHLVFDQKILSGFHIAKYTTLHNDAFQSVIPPLGHVEKGEMLYMNFNGEEGTYDFKPLNEHYIPLIIFTPGNNDAYRQCDLSQNPNAVLIETYGQGNILKTAREFLEDCKNRNIPVFARSSVFIGNADATYEAGRWAVNDGLVTMLYQMTRAASVMALQRYLTDGLRGYDLRNAIVKRVKKDTA